MFYMSIEEQKRDLIEERIKFLTFRQKQNKQKENVN